MRDSPRGDARRLRSDMTALAGRVALVTGAGRRVGRAIALALGAQGMRVVVHYNASAEGARETARLIVQSGAQASTVQADLADAAACERLRDATVREQRELFLLVNSAAIMVRTPVGPGTRGRWDGGDAS